MKEQTCDERIAEVEQRHAIKVYALEARLRLVESQLHAQSQLGHQMMSLPSLKGRKRPALYKCKTCGWIPRIDRVTTGTETNPQRWQPRFQELTSEMFGRKKNVVIETYTSPDIKKLNRHVEKEIDRYRREGYRVMNMSYTTESWLGVTVDYHCVVTFGVAGA